MSAAKTLATREIQRHSGQKAAEVAQALRVTEKHASKLLTELGKDGLIGVVRCADGYRWFLAAEVDAEKMRVREQAKRARAERNILYLIDWRARKRESGQAPQVRPVPNSVFALGAT